MKIYSHEKTRNIRASVKRKPYKAGQMGGLNRKMRQQLKSRHDHLGTTARLSRKKIDLMVAVVVETARIGEELGLDEKFVQSLTPMIMRDARHAPKNTPLEPLIQRTLEDFLRLQAMTPQDLAKFLRDIPPEGKNS